jgi:G:T-mismatch repair DNA endonuclease (very short patch repair protein)
MDRLDLLQRSALMAKISSFDTSAEVRVRKAAYALGLRFRIHPS